MLPLEGPPSYGRVLQALSWFTWLVIVVCAASFIVASGKIGVALRAGGELEGMRGLLLTAGAALLAGGAAALTNALL